MTTIEIAGGATAPRGMLDRERIGPHRAAWLAVGLPIEWGVWIALTQTLVWFRHA